MRDGGYDGMRKGEGTEEGMFYSHAVPADGCIHTNNSSLLLCRSISVTDGNKMKGCCTAQQEAEYLFTCTLLHANNNASLSLKQLKISFDF